MSRAIGPANPVRSYLNIDALMEAALSSQADAVHPGYGFLSENAGLAKAVEEAGLTWIGPSSRVMDSIESKSFCRQLASELGVPVVPGSDGLVKDAQDVVRTAGMLGYPLLLKLDRGGGGKGIEMVRSEQEISDVLERVGRIGALAFGDSGVYVETAVSEPRHIEVQFLADAEGNVVCLGERECSIQRRHQKIIEESPSPIVTTEERSKLMAWTARLAARMGYVGAGTMEFLRTHTGAYYFMEVNARLQVEHPVSEMVTGQDVVQWQLRIASGELLSISQADVTFDGHAIEARCYAEDPRTFAPSPGVVTALRLPVMGRYVRIDHALEPGGSVPPYYDPLIAKVISWDKTRMGAVERLAAALEGFSVAGISTTVPLNRAIVDSDAYRAADLHTGFIEDLIGGGVAWDQYGLSMLEGSAGGEEQKR